VTNQAQKPSRKSLLDRSISFRLASQCQPSRCLAWRRIAGPRLCWRWAGTGWLRLAVASRSSELFAGAWSAGPAPRDRLLSAAAAYRRAARRGGLLCRCACPIVAGIRGRAAVDQRLETIVSLRWIGLRRSWRRGLKRQACCCFWRDAEHRRPLGMKLDHEISKDRAIPSYKKYLDISIPYNHIAEAARRRRGPLFCPAARFAVCVANKRSVIASREYGLY
jgi:hypothetical protein